MNTMNKILVILGITTLSFMALCFYFIWHDRVLPDSLIYSYFSAIGAEGFIMGWIKTNKIKDKSEERTEKEQNPEGF